MISVTKWCVFLRV